MSSKCVEFATIKQLYELFAEYGAAEESVRNDVQYLKEWLRKQPHLPNIEDDEWLTNFLFRCKNSLERTKKSIDAYFITKATMPEFFQGRDQCFDQMEEILQQGCMIPSLKLTPDGYRIIFLRGFGDSEKTAFNFDGIVKLAQMVTDVGLKKDFIRGWIVIADTQNLKTNAILYGLSTLKKGYTLGYDIVPDCVRKAYIINSFPAIEPAFKIFKLFFKNKLTNKIEVWKDDPKNLISVIPKEVLPTNYGGNAGSLEELRDIWYSELEKYRNWLISDEQYKADLRKKPVDHLCNNDISTDYGVNGSFRKICLD